ncbi:AAA family ATPase [Glutamicibacter sp. AOP12-B1-11]|uniref:AAA family ATPase n=1 Tax=Glutamicibacter sp. AOP12-B1-11 TaxID=3457725 RepID=UPI0040342853
MSTQITEATLKNFQKVSYAKIEPSGNLIVLAGKNGAGKTSTNDGLEAALTGHNGRNIKRPIKDGHGKATIDIKLSDGSTLIRGYTPSGTTLKGLDAAGNKFGQRDLDARISSLGIDGRKFISLGDKEQLQALLSIVDLPFKPAELDAERKSLEAQRLAVGQQGKAIGDPVADPNIPAEETSVSELLGEYRKLESAQQERNKYLTDLNESQSKVQDLERQLAAAREHLANVTESLGHMSDFSADLDALRVQIDTSEDANAAIRANNQVREQAQRKLELRAQYEGLTEQIKALDQRKTDGLAQAEMPIEGLTFDDEGVLYQGVPFSRASGREQLIVSCAMIMATNPEIRVIVIRDGNVLDMEGMEILQSMAEATNFQVFIELVKEDKGEEEYFFAEGELV